MTFIKRNISASHFFATFVFWLVGNHLYAQHLAQHISQSLTNYQSQAIQEKLYVHTDKDYYLTGEILWYKVYAVDASLHRPLDLSKVCYIELLDSSNTPLAQSKIAMNNATGNGSLYLQQLLPAGNYKLRAYTRWMQNFDANWYFEKKITIVNLNKLPDIAGINNEPSVHIDFFPEGGNLVSGLENKVAFKAVEKNGGNIDFTGILLDNADTLLRFNPTHNGMGYFTFTPQQGHSYTAKIIPLKGKLFNSPLPKAMDGGTALQVLKNGALYTVQATTNLTDHQVLYLLAHTRNQTKITAEIQLENGKGLYSFEQSKLGDGISAITLFNKNGEPICERLVFKYPEQNMGIDVASQKTIFLKRDEVSISIHASSLADGDSASVSLSVFKLDSLQAISPLDIQSYLLLSSDLKGHIDNPSYYFKEPSAETDQALDLLLLTQGWRRFDWQNVLSKKQQRLLLAPELQGHIITGTVINTSNNQSAKGVTAYLSAPSPINIFKPALSDANGFIKADLPNYFGSNKLIAQAEDNIYKVQLNNPFGVNYSARKLPAFYRPVTFPNTLLEQSVGMQVQNIYTAAEMNRHTLPEIADTTDFYGKPDMRYKLDDYTRFTTIEEVLREYVTLVDVRIKDKEVSLRMIDPSNKVYLTGNPLVLLDGVPQFNLAQFFELDPKKVSSLDIIAQQYILGNYIFNGIINWKTYQPSPSNYLFEKNVTVADYESLQLARVFYSPQYNAPEQLASHMPDYRNVLYWNPDIMLKKQTITNNTFYTSDLPGKYVVMAEGISATGKMGSSYTYFEVK
jgi:hypothetical protein